MSTMSAISNPHIIRNPGSEKSRDSKKVIMDGIIRGSLNAFQRKAESNIITTAEKSQSNNADIHKAGGKTPKTKLRDGFMPYPGSSKV